MYLAKAWLGKVVTINAPGEKCSRWLHGHKKMLFLLSFVTCRVEEAQLKSVKRLRKSEDKFLLMLCCEAVAWWHYLLRGKIIDGWGLQGGWRAKWCFCFGLNQCMFCTSAKLNPSFHLGESQSVSCHHGVMEFAQMKEQDGQSKEQQLNLGACWRRRAHFWEGKACQKIELGSGSLGKVRAGKNQEWLTVGRTRVWGGWGCSGYIGWAGV